MWLCGMLPFVETFYNMHIFFRLSALVLLKVGSMKWLQAKPIVENTSSCRCERPALLTETRDVGAGGACPSLAPDECLASCGDTC